MYPSCCNIDNEEYEVPTQPEAPQHLDREEVSAGDGSKMRLNEGVPACTTPAFRRGFESMGKQDVLDSIARDFVAQVEESPAQARVTPGRIFFRHAEDKADNIQLRWRPSRARLLGSVVLGCNQLAVPTQQRVGCHDGTKLLKRSPADGLGLFG